MAHEIAHQWFGNTATEKSFAHVWLSEGFATYLTDMYIEQKYGVDSFQKRLEQERQEAVEFAKSSKQAVVDSTSDLMDLLSPNSYQKGAWILHMLRNEVGDTNFKKIIRTYFNQYKFANADTRDLQKVAENVSGKELGWFFDQWLYRPGVPVLDIDMKVDGENFKLEIKQGERIYRFPIDVQIIGNLGTESFRQTFYVDGKEKEFKIKTTGPFRVVIDPDKKLLYTEK